jgi:hypothetical protein
MPLAQPKTNVSLPTNRRLGVLRVIELNHAGAAGTTVRLILDFGTFDLSDRGEEFHKILVAGGPRQLDM